MLQRTSLVDPYCHKQFRLGDSAFTAALFSQPNNWSLSQLTSKDQAIRTEFADRLGQLLHHLDVGRALAPSPVKFTDRIINTAELTKQVPVGPHMLYCNPEKPADGAPI
ncbi:MAG TPA: hypothetical protein VIY48_13635, partial [Candidatus Paceibacterota bacterium]